MIRLARVGARKQPHYRIVVIEKDRARNGRSVEVVGTYNPRTNPATVDLKRDRIDYWKRRAALGARRQVDGAKASRSSRCRLELLVDAIFGHEVMVPKDS
jgi:small subunit ribosomal protein S16